MEPLRDEVEQVVLMDPREIENTKPLEETTPISIHPEYPDRHVMIGTELTEELRSALVEFLKRNFDFLPDPKVMSRVLIPRSPCINYTPT